MVYFTQFRRENSSCLSNYFIRKLRRDPRIRPNEIKFKIKSSNFESIKSARIFESVVICLICILYIVIILLSQNFCH